jgi:CRP-like cAMP-binding protein
VLPHTTATAELSSPLRNELVLFLFSGVLERLPFFHSKRPSFTAAIATHLRLEYAEPGEVIMRQGELGEVLYFVADGQLDVCVDNAPAEPPPAPKALPPARTAGASPAAGSRPAGSGGSGGGVAGVLRAGDGFGEYSALLGEQNRTE